MKKETYLLDHRLKWSIFKKLYDATPSNGPTPTKLAKMLWQLMRDKKIAIGLDTKLNDLIFWTHNPPKGLKVISNKK